MRYEPWTGCYYCSEGCANCYFYGPNAKYFGKSTVHKTDKFDYPVRKNIKGEYLLKGGQTIATCFTTDFFLPEADEWRKDVWAMIKERQDLEFIILTKRISRFLISLPTDWGDGYKNVFLGCTVENQKQADERLPLFLSYPIKRRFIACSPLLGHIDLSKYLNHVEQVSVSGETAKEARLCDFEWVKCLYQQCEKANVKFWFKATGSQFKYSGETKKINPFKQSALAKEIISKFLDNRSKKS